MRLSWLVLSRSVLCLFFSAYVVVLMRLMYHLTSYTGTESGTGSEAPSRLPIQSSRFLFPPPSLPSPPPDSQALSSLSDGRGYPGQALWRMHGILGLRPDGRPGWSLRPPPPSAVSRGGGEGGGWRADVSRSDESGGHLQGDGRGPRHLGEEV